MDGNVSKDREFIEDMRLIRCRINYYFHKITEKKADYIISIKGNQKIIQDEVKEVFNHPYKTCMYCDAIQHRMRPLFCTAFTPNAVQNADAI